MKALAYLRRSKRADAATVSLDVQRGACRQYASRSRLLLADELVDDGVSGTDRDRFIRLAELVKTTGTKDIIVYSIDRLARDVSGLLDELARYERLGVRIHCATQAKVISVAKAHEFLAIGVEALVAEHYSRLISEKTKDAHERLKTEGRRRSRFLPIGYDIKGDRLVPNLDVQSKLAEARALRERGLTLRAIDLKMREQGLRLAVSTWGKLLQREGE